MYVTIESKIKDREASIQEIPQKQLYWYGRIPRMRCYRLPKTKISNGSFLKDEKGKDLKQRGLVESEDTQQSGAFSLVKYCINKFHSVYHLVFWLS